jgi:putative hydrolase of the HAD superfamily
MCQAMRVEPEQVVHIGDNWQFDYVAPSEMGIQAFYLDRKRQTNHQNSVASLLQLKVCLID